MTEPLLEILLISGHEEDERHLRTVLRACRAEPFDVVCVADLSAALDALGHDRFDLIVTNLDADEGCRRDARRALAEAAPDTPLVAADTRAPEPAQRIDADHLASLIRLVVERRALRAALRDSEARLRDISESSSDWMWETDGSYRLTFTSTRAAVDSGLDASRFLGKTVWELSGVADPEADPVWRKHYADLVARRPFRDFQYSSTAIDGRLRHFKVSGKPFFDQKGVFLGFRGSGTDFTAEVESFDRAREAETRIRNIAANLPGVIFQRVRRPDGAFECTFASAHAPTLLGHDRGTLAMAPEMLFERAHADDRGRVTDAFEESATSLQPVDMEYRIVTAGDDVKWVHCGARSRRTPDGDVVWDGLILDITERKSAETELEQLNAELMTAHRAAGMAEAATGVLHNVGNALNSLNVSVSLARNAIRESRVSKLGKVVELLHEHGDDLARFLTEDEKGKRAPAYLEALTVRLEDEQKKVLAELDIVVQKVEHIKVIVSMQQSYASTAGIIETVSLPALVDDVIAMVVPEDVDVERDYADLPPIATDKHKALQIVANLVRNAKQALDACDRSNKRVTVRILERGDRAAVEVSDNGVGIGSDEHKRLFEHGFTTKKHGHGFGLHASALAAKELGGSLDGESAGRDRGATFTLELPLHRMKRAA